jgi:hypothetical protein
MAVFFQDIPDDHFNIESDFVVKESKNTNLVIGIFMLLVSVAAFSISAIVIGGVTLAIAIGALTKTSKDEVILQINKTGIYYYGQLLTDWDHFKREEFIDELPLPSGNNPGVNDKFFLMIKYYKDGYPGYYGRKIQLTNSQDKSEEEIFAAIKFYYKNRQKAIQ